MSRPRAGLLRLAALAWRDTRESAGRLVLLGTGVAVGVAALALVLALAAGVESVVMKRVLGVLPDQVVVEPGTMSMGPLQLSQSSIDQATVDRIRALRGVRQVLRRVRVPLPAHLTASYSGRSFYTDVIVECVEPELVAGDARSFELRPPGEPVPAVMPTVMMDLLNVGLSVNTGLPGLSESAIVGHHFQLNIGSSSFKWGPTVSWRCEIQGISPRIGMGGPAIPLGYLASLREEMKAKGGTIPDLGASSLTVLMHSPADVDDVTEAVRAMGLSLPQVGRASQVSGAIRGVALALSLFGFLVLMVAGTGIANGLGMMVKDEAGEIGLFRAVGASYRDVLVLYQLRAACIGLVGSVAGLLLAALGAMGLNLAAARALPGLLAGGDPLAALSPLHLLGALAFGLLASLLAGFFPAREAARINPAAALRER